MSGGWIQWIEGRGMSGMSCEALSEKVVMGEGSSILMSTRINQAQFCAGKFIYLR